MALSSTQSRSREAQIPMSLLGASLAAGAGALVWAAVAYFTGYEVGYVAWGIGAVVGIASVRFGGHGLVCAAGAAVLSVVGIGAGKLLGTHFAVGNELRKACEESFTPELHKEMVRDAADWAELGGKPGDAELRTFLVEHGYTAAESPESVPQKELVEFQANMAPLLASMHANKTSYEDWFAERAAESRQRFDEEFSIVQANIDELNLIDAVFVLLGVVTAFGIVQRAEPKGPPPGFGALAGEESQDLRKAA